MEAKFNYAARLVHSLQIEPLCDHPDIEDLTPEQQAALHAFLHEILAAYHRMRIFVPEKSANTLLSAKFAKALGLPQQAAR